MENINVRYLWFKSRRNFGIELEVNEHLHAKEIAKVVKATDPDRDVITTTHYQQDFDNSYWHVKFDRSCSDVKNIGGWEIASYKANGYKDIVKMGKMADAVKTAGAGLNNECGFHIHAEIADFKHSQAATLVANWCRIEPIIMEMLPKHRRNNKYAKPLARKFEGLFGKVFTDKQFWDLVRPKNFDNPNRRVSLNMCNYVQWANNRKTVELRLPEGTLDNKEIKNWIRFFLHFVDFTRRKEFPGNIQAADLARVLHIVGLHGDNPFFLLSKGLRETKMWFLKRLLLYSENKTVRKDAERFLAVLETKTSEKVEELKEKLRPKPGVSDWMTPFLRTVKEATCREGRTETPFQHYEYDNADPNYWN